jgi:hypothetical protein
MNDNIQEHMEVLAADGSHVGTVDHLDGEDRIKLTHAESSSFARNDFARSDIASKRNAPRWWIQRISWRARNRFSPIDSTYAASPAASKSSRLTATFCSA